MTAIALSSLLSFCLLATPQGSKTGTGPLATDQIESAIGRLAIMDQATFALAIRRLASFGSPAVPRISQVVKDKGFSAQVRNGCLQALIQMGGKVATPALDSAIVALGDSLSILRAQSLVLIGKIGAPDARKALDKVKTCLDDKDVAVRRLALYVSTLLVDDKDAWLPRVIAGLDDKDASVRFYALRTLEEVYRDKADVHFDRILPNVADPDSRVSRVTRTLIASMGDKAVPQLVKILGDESSRLEYRMAAMDVIGIMRPVRREAVKALMSAYRKLDAETAKSVVNTMRRLGKHVVPDFVTLAQDESASEELRLRAMEMLGTIGDASREQKDVFLAFLKSSNPKMQQTALETISKIRAGVPGVADTVMGFLTKGSSQMRLTAASAVGRLGDEGRRIALPIVRKLMTEGDAAATRVGVTAISSLGSTALELVPGFVRVLESEDVGRRLRMVDAMARIGPSVVPALLDELTKTDSARLRRSIILVFQALGPSVGDATPKVVAALHELLKRSEEVLQRDAAFALGRLAWRAKEALPRLEKLAISGTSDVRVAALGALRAIAGDQDSVVDVVERCLEAKDSTVRWAAIEALGVPGNKRAVPILIRYVTSEDRLDRIKAGHALGSIGQLAEEAIPVIEKQLREETDRDVTLALAGGANRIKGLKKR